MPRLPSRRRRGRPRHPDVLTPAEWRVLEHVRGDLTNAEIAGRLGLSPETVKTHISNMLAKLALPDRQALAGWQGAPAEIAKRKPGRFLGLGALGPAFLAARKGKVGLALKVAAGAAAGVASIAIVVAVVGGDDNAAREVTSESEEGLAQGPRFLSEEEAGYAGAQRALAAACPTGSGEFEEASINARGNVAHGIRPTSEIPADLRAAIAREKPNWSGVFDTWVFSETQVTLVAHAGIQIDGRSFAAGAVTLGFYERENGERFWAVPESGLMYDC